MLRRSTKLDYAERMTRVVAHIGAHLDAPLDLERLAGVACFSPYHFHRIYRLVVGETPDQTVRRLRLHRAAVALANDGLPLPEIASRAGYASPEAFSRAFTSAYGHPPSAYRAQRLSGELPGNGPPPPGALAQEVAYEVTIKPLPGFRLFGLPHRGDYNAIVTAFERLFALGAAHGLLMPGTRDFGIYYDDPGSVPEAELRGFAGLAVGPEAVCPDDFEETEIPAGRAACLLYQGPYADLDRAYHFLYGRWLPQSGYEPADQPAFEEYLNDPKSLPPTEWLTEICLPLLD
ncbi:AraC family transcriptional regulator [Algihabitans albus]|uniref:AraC family transcriptional regulator n=1 Tax=Algihabitans albus TaxID=2164067 RepID=UPI0035CF4C7A